MSLRTWLMTYFCGEKDSEILKLEADIVTLKDTISDNELLIEENNDFILRQTEMIGEIQKELTDLKLSIAPDPLEEYWNNKREKTNSLYSGRNIIGQESNVTIDPRMFFHYNDSTIPLVTGSSNDNIAQNALKRVIRYITYTSDTTLFKKPETWLFAFETWKLRKGDCEDGAILLANMLLRAGIPYWRIRLNAGDVKGGGHAWVSYLREEDDEWYCLDWCYWPNDSLDWLKYKDAENYYSIWFSWNPYYIFGDEILDREE